jgi:hypothetical protein
MTTESLLSVVVPINRDKPDLAPLHTAYRRALETPGRQLQFIYVVDGPLEAALASLRTLKRGASRSKSCITPTASAKRRHSPPAFVMPRVSTS